MDKHREHVPVLTGRATVSALVDSMTLAEKVGQMTQVELGSITPDEVATWSIGSVLPPISSRTPSRITL